MYSAIIDLPIEGLEIHVKDSLYQLLTVEYEYGNPVLILFDSKRDTKIRVMVEVETVRDYEKRKSIENRLLQNITKALLNEPA